MSFPKVILWTVITAFCNTSAFALSITIGGTGNALGTMTLLAEEYEKANPEIDITLLPSIGSSGAIKAVPLGKIDLGLSARPFKDNEFTGGSTAVKYSRSPTVVAVSDKSLETNITIKELVDIYTGDKTRWTTTNERIRPIIRQMNDSTTKQLNLLSTELKKALEIGTENTEFPFAATDQEAVSMIETVPGSFGITTLALILSEKRDIHALSLDGLDPFSADNNYPMNTYFYFIIPEQLPSHVEDFLEFVNSPVGTALLQKYGNYKP